MKIVSKGYSDYSIVIPATATVPNVFAAQELAKYILAVTGAALPVISDDTPARCHEICVGPVSREGLPCTCGMKWDGYVWKTVGERIFLLGENDRAQVFSVYRFLEKYLGVRFFAPDVERIPQRSCLCLPEMDERLNPAFEYRAVYWNAFMNADMAGKRGLNGQQNNLDDQRGASIKYHGFVHTMNMYLPPDEFFDEHPEYYAIYNGERQKGHYWQLCLTNPDVFKIVLERVMKAIEEHPEATIFSVSQNDGFGPCQCPECTRVNEEEGGTYGGTVLRFVNAIAREVGKKYPNVIIDTLAYRFTRQPLKITRPEPNVCVRICTIECCFAHPIAECVDESAAEKVDGKATPTMQQDFDGWRDIHDRLHVWDYTTDFWHYLSPFPNFAVLQPNIQYFIDHHVTGLFEQGNGESISGEFGELRGYLLSKLMWEPNGDMNQWMNDFLVGYYGQGASAIRAYIDMLEKHVTENKVHVGIYNHPEVYLTDELLEKAQVLWDRAQLAEGDGPAKERIARSRMQLRYVQLRRMRNNPDRAKLVEEFIQDVQKFGITRIAEFRPLEISYSVLRLGKCEGKTLLDHLD